MISARLLDRKKIASNATLICSHCTLLLGQLDPWRWERQIVPKRRFQTTLRRVITQKTEKFVSALVDMLNLITCVLVSNIDTCVQSRSNTITCGSYVCLRKCNFSWCILVFLSCVVCHTRPLKQRCVCLQPLCLCSDDLHATQSENC